MVAVHGTPCALPLHNNNSMSLDEDINVVVLVHRHICTNWLTVLQRLSTGGRLTAAGQWLYFMSVSRLLLTFSL